MKVVFAIVLIGIAALSGGASARQATGPANDIVAARKAAFAMSAVTLNAINEGIEADAAPSSQGFAVGALRKWAHALPGAFPAGTGATDMPGATAAEPEIWTDRAGFEARAADYAAAVDRLAELSQANDVAGFEAQFAVVKASCGACHNLYRIERARN